MPIEKTLDGRNIEFPEGYDTPEGRKRIIIENPYSTAEDELAVSFILTRGMIKELGGDDKVWKNQNGEWNFKPPWELVSEIVNIFGKSRGGMRERILVAHPQFSDLWLPKEGGESKQIRAFGPITARNATLWKGVNKLVNPNDVNWTDELRQKRDDYFRESVKLLHMILSEGRSPSGFEERLDSFEEAFNQSSFADYVQLPSDWRKNDSANTIREIAKRFEMLDKEKVRRAIEEKQVVEEKVASNLMQRVTEDGDITSIVREFDVQLNKTQDRYSLLLKLQKQFGNVPPEKKRVVVERFERNKLLSEYIKELYGWKCQICGFTFKQNNGSLYAETHHLEALSKGGKDSLDNMVVVCPNHHAMFDHADVSILNVTPEKISVIINEKHYEIKRITLR